MAELICKKHADILDKCENPHRARIRLVRAFLRVQAVRTAKPGDRLESLLPACCAVDRAVFSRIAKGQPIPINPPGKFVQMTAAELKRHKENGA